MSAMFCSCNILTIAIAGTAVNTLSVAPDNHSHSLKGAFRRLRFILRKHQEKLVMAVRRRIYDIVAGACKALPTFEKSEAVFLSGVHNAQFRGPEDFSPGFVRFSDTANYEIKRTDYYDNCDKERRLRTSVNSIIYRPIGDLTASKKSAMASSFTALHK